MAFSVIFPEASRVRQLRLPPPRLTPRSHFILTKRTAPLRREAPSAPATLFCSSLLSFSARFPPSSTQLSHLFLVELSGCVGVFVSLLA